MAPDEVTTYFLLCLVIVVIGFEAIAYRHPEVMSTITHVIGRWLREWPPLFGILIGLAAFLLWHFWLAADHSPPAP
jgi:hypothetical protein